jgi:hypothetical protein
MQLVIWIAAAIHVACFFGFFAAIRTAFDRDCRGLPETRR